MRQFLSFLTAVISLFLATISHAGDSEHYNSLKHLRGDSLKNAFSGLTVDGTYKAFRERSGTSHFTETFTPDGKTFYREGDIVDEGE